MYPAKIPSKAPRGERDVFALIRDSEKSDDYVCLYSVGLTGHRRKEYAEADFVIIGPEGVFCIEAKGGGVTRKGGVWTIGPPGDTYTSSEGPFAQSEGVVHPMRKHLKSELGLGRDDVLIGWGVAFPHITFTETSPEWDQQVVYDERDKNNGVVAYIKRLEQYFLAVRAKAERRPPSRLNAAQIKQIASTLRGDFELVPTVKSLIGDSRRELASLSPLQFLVLDLALNPRNPRIICDGAAGTGKTLIAIEAARRLADEGKKVLLLCFNAQLGRFLAADAAEAETPFKVSTVHSFLIELIRKGGLRQQLQSATKGAPDYFTRIVPDLFEKAAYALIEEEDLPQYDVIILDEAQDVLNAPILNCLDLILKGGFKAGRWLLFLDTGVQADVYGRMDGKVLDYLRTLDPAEFELSDNFRNPKAVVGEMCEVTGCAPPICRRVLVSTVDYRRFTDGPDQGRKLRALLVELMREGVPASSISILSAKTKAQSCVVLHPPDIGKTICELGDGVDRCPADAISASSISAFKGLENEVVILTDVPSLEPSSEWARSMLYVGMTRARSKLYMLVDQDYLDARTR